MKRVLLAVGGTIALAWLGMSAVAQQAEMVDGSEHGTAMAESEAARESSMETADWVTVSDDPEKDEVTFRIGPVDLSEMGGHHNVKQPPLVTVEVPRDGFLYGFELRVEDGEGKPIPQAVVHHVNLIDPDHRELFSPVAQRLFAAGSETQSASMPKWLGIPMKEGQRLMVSSMFHNPTGKPQPVTYLNVVLKYRSQGWLFPVSVHPVYIDVMGHVGPKDFDLPPGKYERSWEGSPAIEGRLLGAGGHLHEYATRLLFEDVTTGEALWDIGPVLDEAGKLETVPVGKFWWKGGIRLSSDHTYRLTVFYDNPTGESIPAGGMGVLGGIYKPSGAVAWPVVDPKDPEYLANMEETRLMAELRAAGMAGHGDHGTEAVEEHDHATHEH